MWLIFEEGKCEILQSSENHYSYNKAFDYSVQEYSERLFVLEIPAPKNSYKSTIGSNEISAVGYPQSNTNV